MGPRAGGPGATRARAVEIALVNNPDLQATYEELGISQADMVQAGLLRNPSFGAELGFRVNSGANDELRLSLVQDFLDLFVLPLRKQIAREQFEADTLRVAHRALDVAAEVEKGFVAAQASAELVAFRRTIVEAAAAAAELSQRQLEAGNVSELDQATQQATYEQARLDLARDEVQLAETRERVNRLLGLWGETASWRLAEALPPLPESEPKVEHLESLAMRQRLDVAVARRQVALLSKAVDLARTTRLFGRIDVGVDMHRDPNGPLLLGPNLVIELPIFDQRQAVIARLEAQQREQERKLSAITIGVRSEVRLAEVHLRAGRQTVLHYRDVLLPLRKRVADQTLLHYNGMFVGAYQLLAAKQGEVDARRGYLDYLPVTVPNGAKLPWKIVDGVKVFHMVAEEVDHEFAPGLKAQCWGYNGRVHGPVIEAVEGDRVRIYVTNRLPGADHRALARHPAAQRHGRRRGLTQKAIQPGETFKYEFTLRQHGTGMYHPHHDEMTQMALGMMGMFVIHPALADRQARRSRLRHHAARVAHRSRRQASQPERDDRLQRPDHERQGFPRAPRRWWSKTGERVRIRIGNLSAMDHHPIHLHGYQFKITETDGGQIPESAQWPETTVLVPVGSTRTIEFVADEPGDWAMHCHMTHHVMNQMGHGTPNMIGVKPGASTSASARSCPAT